MDREGFRNRMKQYKKAREESPGLKYWEWKAQPAEKDIPEYDGGADFVTYNPYELRRNIQRVLNTTPEGEVNPFYNSLDDTYGSVELPETTVTAPYTRRASLAQQARQGREAYYKAGQKAAPILAAIPIGAGILGAASVFGFGPTLDMIDVASDPVNPLSYVDKFDLSKIKNGWKYGKTAYRFGKEAILAKMMDVSRTGDVNTVANRFRGAEWGNFLSSKNGDAYYRLQREKGLSPNDPEEKLFVSHTTPWEEFLGLPVHTSLPIEQATPYLTGKGTPVLYEFPTEVFGDLPASTHIPSAPLRNVSVIDQGKKHLIYGDTSSGARGRVQTLTSSLADMLHTDPYRYDGILDRPLINLDGEFIYDAKPDYENIFEGYQTVLQKKQLKDAIENSQHTVYEFTPDGIQKTIHVGTPIKKR